MKDGPMGNRVARTLAVAVAGLFAGHVIVYRILAPGPLQRSVLAGGASHAYLPFALAMGLMLALVAGARTFRLGFRRATVRGTGQRRPGFAGTLILPAVAQAAAFIALEVLERVLAGAPMGTLLGPLLPVGVALQLVVGATGGLLLAGLDRAGEVTGRAVAAPRRPAAPAIEPHRWPPATPTPRHRPRSAQLIRGPPAQA
jgi:hypothetical protein